MDIPATTKTTANQFIVIEGNIGAGKTTFVNLAAPIIGSTLVLEQFKENPFLPKFYSNPNQYAFPLELSFLAERYQQQKTVVLSELNKGNAVLCDYYFIKSYIFARLTLSGDELALYKQMFEIMTPQVPVPELYVYIHREVPDLLKHIKKRGRPYEMSISADYLDRIQESYFSFLQDHPDYPVVVVNAGNKDFENNQECLAQLTNLLKEGKGPGKTTFNL